MKTHLQLSHWKDLCTVLLDGLKDIRDTSNDVLARRVARETLEKFERKK